MTAIRSSIGRILKNAEHSGAIGLTPYHLMRRRADEGAHRQWQIVLSQVAHHGPCTVKLAEFGEDQAEPRLHLLIGIENDLARAIMCQTSGKRKAQLAACRFLTLTLMETLPDLVQLRLAHDAGQTEQQAIMVGAGIIETFAVGNDDAEERAQIEELMPVAIVAGKPGSVEADDEAGITQSDFGNQLLEAHPLDGPGSGFAKIFIDDVHAFMRPAEGHGTVDEAVLQFRAFLMMPHLVHGGLADVNVSELAAMRRSDALVRAI